MSIPSALRHLVDDAAIFPPGLLPLDDAVTAHRDHLHAAHAELVGPFVVDVARLDPLVERVTRTSVGEEVAVSVVVPTPRDVEAAVQTVASSPGLRLEALEVKIDAGHDDVSVLASHARTVQVFVELPRPHDPRWPELLAGADAAGLHAKFRTGGTQADAFPDDAELARWIGESVAAGVAFKCTAGLHRAVRHHDPSTGFEHHGYLNVLLATVRARRGADVDALRATLAEADVATVVAALEEAGSADVEDARTAFLSYGSCSILEPLQDLTALGLVPGSPDSTPPRGEAR